MYYKKTPILGIIFNLVLWYKTLLHMKKIIYSILLSTLLYSCSESRIQGCTDYIAANYNPSADYDNGSCIYVSDIVFW